MRAVAPLAALALAAACAGGGAGARRETGSRCDEAWGRVTFLLRAGLEEYLEGMRRFAAARDGASTAPAEARARARAADWEAARRAGFADACRTFSAETERCLGEAASARDLHACGQGPLVGSFTDEVLAAFAASPLR